ncbi:Heme ABC type transporter HtsABC, permease protein HtsB [Staphylococcus aureus]|uniref:Heme ABC type transporter HtsABC, permease protein HtsB n=1 Tax=Staphylococcus aureus TaxID=1280 RepID=A0A2X2JU62_STAAU|nr:Heme ABC type transporter HtsABC, permease protein HtsB [Staphylococcus aureus]
MAIKELSSQSAIDHKRKRRTTLTYMVSVCFLFICVYLNMAIGSSKINFSDIVHYVTGHTDTKSNVFIT